MLTHTTTTNNKWQPEPRQNSLKEPNFYKFDHSHKNNAKQEVHLSFSDYVTAPCLFPIRTKRTVIVWKPRLAFYIKYDKQQQKK